MPTSAPASLSLLYWLPARRLLKRVPGRTAKEAIETFAGFLNETLSCLTVRRLAATQKADNTFALLYGSPTPLTNSDGKRYYLRIAHICNAVRRDDGTFKARTREYSYSFSDSAEDIHH